jgi:hypothetical protein|tara:strand:- start:791 stop:1009 length:219 start_codon:yes stop_codon:yes gene_type:complete
MHVFDLLDDVIQRFGRRLKPELLHHLFGDLLRSVLAPNHGKRDGLLLSQYCNLAGELHAFLFLVRTRLASAL